MISLRENLDKQHVPVLKEEILSYAEPICSRPQSLVIDCTLGLGGHSEAILERYKNTRVIGIDKDESVLSEVNKRLEKKFPRRFTSFNLCFSQLDRLAKAENKPDFILADLGISSFQLDDLNRGFSFKSEAPLDMRMDIRQDISADTILNSWDERKLFLVFAEGGVGIFSKQLAKKIVDRRPIKNTGEFTQICVDLFSNVYKRGKSKKSNTNKAHPATVPFQAVRIAVNNELDALKKLLVNSINTISFNGRISVISFHSLEDKFTANSMRWWSSKRGKGLHHEDEPLGVLLTKKAVISSEDEIKDNPRSRSARLRVFERNEFPLWKERELINYE